MKKINYLLTGIVLYSVSASQAMAQGGFAGGSYEGTGLNNFLTAVINFINDILVPLVMALAFLAFVWGMFKYFIAGGADEGKREEGKSLMIWAVVGFVMIIILYGLVNFLATTIGLEDQVIQPPSVPLPTQPYGG